MPDAPRITPRAKSRRAHQIGLLTGGLLLIFWGMLGYWALNARHAAIENRTARLEQTVSIVEEQSAQMLSLIKLALLSADHWVAEHPSEDPGENRDFIRWAEEVRITSGQRVDVRMVTRDDKLSYIPRRADAGITDVSDREYVRIQKDPATRGFHIAAPVFSRVTKKWGIPISIPATNEHGRIAVLFGAIEQDSLTRLHTPHLDDAEESIYLLRDDGTILSRTPFIAELNGTSLAGTSAWTEYLSREAKGIYRTDQAPFAGVRRIAAFSHLKDFPLIVVASVPVSRILQPWVEQLGLVLLVASLVSVAFILLSIKLARAVEAGERAQALAEQHSIDLEQANRELLTLAVTDKLTQTSNRARLDAVLENELSRARRYGHALSLIMLDIDHFKRINDHFGHQSGDAVLREISTTLRANTRETDTVGRWGGEEFLLVLPQANADQALEVAEKIRRAIAAADFKLGKPTTISLGIASLGAQDNEKTLLARADAALYEAKRKGRNRSVLAPETFAEPA